MVRLLLLSLLGLGAGCAHRAPASSADVDPNASALDRAVDAVKHNRCDLAIQLADEGLTEMPAADATAQYRATRVRSTAGAYMALLQASRDPGPTITSLIPPYWADLLYLKGYCQVETKDMAGAAATFQRQLQLIDGDAPAACELAHLRQEEGDWSGSIELFSAALENAAYLEQAGYGDGAAEPRLWGMTLPQWKGRALRGMGFSYVELNDLDRAEKVYREALALDPKDAQALRELELIAAQRAR